MITTWTVNETNETFQAESRRTATTLGSQSEFYLIAAAIPSLQLKQIVFDAVNLPGVGFTVTEILPIPEGYRLNLIPYVTEQFVCWTGKNEFGRDVKESGAVKATSRMSAISQTRALLRSRGYTEIQID